MDEPTVRKRGRWVFDEKTGEAIPREKDPDAFAEKHEQEKKAPKGPSTGQYL